MKINFHYTKMNYFQGQTLHLPEGKPGFLVEPILSHGRQVFVGGLPQECTTEVGGLSLWYLCLFNAANWKITMKNR
jgi:hypothetical protein